MWFGNKSKKDTIKDQFNKNEIELFEYLVNGNHTKIDKEFFKLHHNKNFDDIKIVFNYDLEYKYLEFYYKDLIIFTLNCKDTFSPKQKIVGYKFHTNILNLKPFFAFIKHKKDISKLFEEETIKKKNLTLQEYKQLVEYYNIEK